jgi:hypothetical protein
VFCQDRREHAGDNATKSFDTAIDEGLAGREVSPPAALIDALIDAMEEPQIL